MGLVMQEPTLFNYTIKENILYGLDDAKDSDIREAASIANALEFIESDELMNTYDESADVLLQAFIDNKEILEQKIGEEEYNKKLDTLEKLKIKEWKEGKFQAVKGEIDSRDESAHDITLN